MNISIIGSGYIGKSLGKYYFSNGFDVTFFDISKEVLQELEKDGYSISNSINEVIIKSDVVFLTLPTPTINQKISLDAFDDTFTKLLNLNLDGKLIIIKSTITPGTTDNFIKKISEKNSDINKKFGVIYNPEFITEIASTWNKSGEEIDFYKESRVVIGESENKEWGDFFIKNLFLQKKTPIIRTNYSEAEMIKYVSNVMLATKISFWNEIYLLTEKLNLSFEDIAKGVSLDSRIGEYGTVTGKAFGGKCLPKDIEAFITFANNYQKMSIVENAKKVNDFMKNSFGVRE